MVKSNPENLKYYLCKETTSWVLLFAHAQPLKAFTVSSEEFMGKHNLYQTRISQVHT